MNYDAYELGRRGGNVSRFHCFRTVLTERVGHHTYNVINTLMACLDTEDIKPRLLFAAMQHDQPEYKTGDIPAPFKRSVPGLREACASEEAKVLQAAGVRNWADDLDEDEERFLKLADSLDGAMFCFEERQAGSVALAAVFKTFCDYVETLLSEVEDDEVYDGFREMYRAMRSQWVVV